MSTEHQSLNLALIRIDGGTQTRATLDADVIREYAEAMTRGEEFPPIIVFYDGSHYWLADGFHRVQAAQDAHHHDIDAEVRQGTQRDAVLHSVQANATHGLPRCAEDKRRAVMRLLEDDEWSLWSDREIARRTRTTHPFVGKIRREVFGDETSAERVVERDGQQYTMSTGGINEGREPTMLELAHDYMRRIPEMLPKTGLLYLTIRNQLGVRQSNKTQMDALQHSLDTLFGQQKLAKKHGRYVVAEEQVAENDDDELIDHIDPVTAEVTRIPAAAGEQSQPDSDEAIDSDTRAWLREQLRDGKRHYNILTRASRADGISMKSLLRVVRAMLDDGEIEQDGRMYGLAGDQHVQVLPDDLADADKIAIRDALVAAVRDEALTAPQINNAIYAATGKRLDIHYLIIWLDKLTHDGKLVTFTSNNDVPRYQLNPTPPSDAELQQRRAAASLAERLAIVRRAIADRSPLDQISVTWLKRAAPAACVTAGEAGNLLTKLVESGELRVADDETHFEPVEAAESSDPGQEGEAAVEPAGEPCERVADAPIDDAPVTGDEVARPVGLQYDEHTAQANTAIEFSTKFELAIFRLDDAFKEVRAIKSIKTWHTLEPRQIESVRKAIEMARAWMFNLDGFLEEFDDALAYILETGESYLDLIETKPLDDEQTEEVQA